MSAMQVPVWWSIQPNTPAPSAPAGSLGQPPPALVRRLRTWSSEGAGGGSGGYGGAGAKEVPRLVSVSHSQAEIVKAAVAAVSCGPHSACHRSDRPPGAALE